MDMDVSVILLGIAFIVLIIIIIALFRNANTTKFTYGNSAYAPGNMQPNAQTSFGNPPTPIFCTRCGKQDVSGRDFCGFCGNKLDRNGVPPYGPMGMEGNSMKQPNVFVRLWKKSPVAVILMFAALGVLIGFIYEAFFSYEYEPVKRWYDYANTSSSGSAGSSYGSNDYSSSYDSSDYSSSYGSDSYGNSYSGYTYDVCSICHGSKLCQVCHGRGGMSYSTYGQGGSGWVDCTGCNGSRRCKYCD